ncbi:MAG TPA: Rieske 2Fe-2S domain-containing protein [Candidatus Bathyarchaeia archaeon]|nr:Rieske 2Fe-2S domain-containing protein [Candidatus Bathyarchaeia archaeon]
MPGAALLPIRFFFGATFLYAGFDKLLDPTFFDPASAASIQSQMAGFARFSPIGELVRFGEPVAVPIGLLIAVTEIGIGLGALTGLAFRVAAAGGAALSILFWLTASWATRPYYIGADLPYAAGWLSLAIAGHGGLLVSRRFMAGAAEAAARSPRARAPDRMLGSSPDSPGRRTFLQTGLLALLALTAASLAVPLRLAGLERTEITGTADGSEAPTQTPASAGGGPTPSPPPRGSGTPGGSATTSTGGIPIGTVSDVEKNGSAAFTVPFTAPAPLPAGDPGVIVRLTDGSFVAFDAVCTHAGCTVEWDAADAVLYCPCHGAAFDPAHQAAVIQGPADQPLAALPLIVDTASGRILLRT